MISSDEHALPLCVEFDADRRAWLDDLPPAPATGTVTVSFDTTQLATRDGGAVRDLGYEPVGAAAVGHADRVAHLMVPPHVMRAHERWWRTVLDGARRVYDLRFGPVQMALRDVIAAHRRTLAGPSGDRPAERGA